MTTQNRNDINASISLYSLKSEHFESINPITKADSKLCCLQSVYVTHDSSRFLPTQISKSLHIRRSSNPCSLHNFRIISIFKALRCQQVSFLRWWMFVSFPYPSYHQLAVFVRPYDTLAPPCREISNELWYWAQAGEAIVSWGELTRKITVCLVLQQPKHLLTSVQMWLWSRPTPILISRHYLLVRLLELSNLGALSNRWVYWRWCFPYFPLLSFHI